jgi:predicted RND superfamily exporter protein
MDLNNQLSLDNSQARVTAFIRSISSNAQLDVADSLNNWLDKEMPQYNVQATGVPIMFGRLTQLAVPGMMKGLILSLILITATMMITFKSFKVGLFSMIPNIWPVLAIFGVVGASGYVVNLSVSVVGMITLGIAVDDTVHFIVKYLMARKEGKDKEESISWTYQQVGAPLLFTSIILIFGFGVLIFSQFALNSDMGMFCSAVIGLALTADFIILPAFLLKFDNGKLV